MMAQTNIINRSYLDVLDRRLPEFEIGEIKTDYGEPLKDVRGVYPLEHQPKTRPVAVVSNRYKLLNHNTVLDSIKKILVEKDDLQNIRTINLINSPDGTKIFLKILFGITKEILEDDKVNFGVEIINSVDGRISLHCIPYTYRWVCSNGAVVTKSLGNVIHKHTTNLNLDALEGSIRIALDSVEAITQKYFDFTQTEVIEMEAVDKEGKEWIAKNIPKKYLEVVESNKPKTAWDLYNIFTRLNTHDTRRSELTKLTFNNAILRAVKILSA